MGITYKAVLKVKKASDSFGIVNIRKTEERKQSFYSLKIRLPKRHWNQKSGTVRKNDDFDFEDINKQIADKIKDLESSTNIPLKSISNKESFLSYFDTYLKRYDNEGTRIKYKQVLTKLIAYLNSKGRKDLNFNEIDESFIFEIRDFTRIKASVNTTTHYLKLLKQVIDSAIKSNLVNYIRHPFISLEYKNTKISKSALSESELNKILNTRVSEDNYLFNTRNCFITQVFLQGMRVSDLQLLKYQNIVNDNVEFTMFKTGAFMSVFISDIVWNIFIYQFKQFMKENKIDLKPLSALEKELEAQKSKAIQLLKEEGVQSGFDLIIDERIKESEMNQMFEPEPVYQEIKQLKGRIFASYKATIKDFARRNGDVFIFDFLKGIGFDKLKRNEKYRRMKNKTIVYNRHLKELQKLSGIDTVLKSHLSRSSYASLLLNSNVDVYNISAALGHSGLNITEKYLAGFNSNNTAEINMGLSSRFYNN